MGFPLTEAEHDAIAARIEGATELVVAVAVATGLGVITQPRPARHHDCFPILYALGIQPNDPIEAKHGFITNHGRFVDRVEAARIVLAAGQTGDLHAMGTDGQPRLFTEDMWNDPGVHMSAEDAAECKAARRAAQEPRP